MLPYVSIALLGVVSIFTSYLFIQLFTSSKKDDALDRDINIMLLQVLKGTVELVLQPLTEFFTSVYSTTISLLLNIKYVVLLVLLVGATIAIHLYHESILPDIDDAWRCVVYPFVRTFLLSFVQLIRVVYALFMPFINFLLIIGGQLIQGTVKTFINCANYDNKSMLEEMIRAFALCGKSFLMFFMEIARFFGDSTQSIFEKDLLLEEPIQTFTNAIAIFETPFVCSCKQFTTPIQAFFKITTSKFIPLIISGAVEFVIRSLQTFINTFQGEFPTMDKVHNSIKRLLLNIGFFVDEIAFITLENLLQTFDTSIRVRVYPKESVGAIIARYIVFGLDILHLVYKNTIVIADSAIENIFGTRLLQGNRIDYLHMHSVMSSYDFLIYDIANNLQFFMYVSANFQKNQNPFDTITTPIELDCELATVSNTRNVPLWKSSSCFIYTFSKLLTPIAFVPIPINGLYMMYELVLEAIHGERQNVWSVMQRYAGMMIDLDTDASCQYRLESTSIDYSISAQNCQCHRRFAYAYRYNEREYTPTCLQPTINYDILKPMDKAAVYFWTLIFNAFTLIPSLFTNNQEQVINFGKPFSVAHKGIFKLINWVKKILKKVNKLKSGSEPEADEEDEEENINPDDFISLPVFQRASIEMIRLFLRFVLALPDIVFGHFLDYPINCGWGLNQTRAKAFFQESFQLAPNSFLTCQDAETENEPNCITYDMMRFSYCEYREYRTRKYGSTLNILSDSVNTLLDTRKQYLHRIVPALSSLGGLTFQYGQNPKIYKCTKTNDNNNCICNPELYLSPASQCRCMNRYPYIEMFNKTENENTIFNNLIYSKYTSIHWCNSMSFEYAMSLYDDQIDLVQWILTFSWLFNIFSSDADKCINERFTSFEDDDNTALQNNQFLHHQYTKRDHSEETFKHAMKRLRADEYKTEQTQKYNQEQTYKEEKRKVLIETRRITETAVAVFPDNNALQLIDQSIQQYIQQETAMTIAYESLQYDEYKLFFNGVCTESYDVEIALTPFIRSDKITNTMIINQSNYQNTIINETELTRVQLVNIPNDDLFIQVTDKKCVFNCVYNITYQKASNNITFQYTMSYYYYKEHDVLTAVSRDNCCEACKERDCVAWTFKDPSCTLFFYEIFADEISSTVGCYSGFVDKVVLDLDMPKPTMYGRATYIIAQTPTLSSLAELNDDPDNPIDVSTPKCTISAYYGPFCNVALLFKQSQESIKMGIRLFIHTFFSLIRLDFSTLSEGVLLTLCQTEKTVGSLVGIIGSFIGLFVNAISTAAGGSSTTFVERLVAKISFIVVEVLLGSFAGKKVGADARNKIYYGVLIQQLVTSITSLNADAKNDLISRVLLQLFGLLVYVFRQIGFALRDIPPWTAGIDAYLDGVKIVEDFLNRETVDFILLIINAIPKALFGDFSDLLKIIDAVIVFILNLIIGIIESALNLIPVIDIEIPRINTIFNSPQTRLRGPHSEIWSDNTECAYFMHFVENKTMAQYTTYEKVTYINCINYRNIAQKILQWGALKHIPDDFLYNWKRKYIMLYQFIHGIVLYMTSPDKTSYQLMMEQFQLDHKMIHELQQMFKKIWYRVSTALGFQNVFESVLQALDPRYNDYNNPSGAAQTYRFQQRLFKTVGSLNKIWVKHHVTQRIYTFTNDLFHHTKHVLHQIILINETHFDHLKHHFIKQYHDAKQFMYSEQPIVQKLQSISRTKEQACEDANCVDCTLINNAIDITSETSTHMARFYNNTYTNISDDVSLYFDTLNQTTRVYVNDIIDRLFQPENHTKWYDIVQYNWIDLYNDPNTYSTELLDALKLFLVTFNKTINITKYNDTYLLNQKQITETFVRHNEIVCVNNTYTLEQFKNSLQTSCDTHIPYFMYGLPYMLQYPFMERCDIGTMIYQKRANRVELFDNAFWNCLYADIVVLTNGYWSVIPLSPIFSIALLIPINYFLFLYSVYGFVPQCAPALPVMLIEDAYEWVINRLIPACFCTYFPILASKCPENTCERCIPKNYTYGNCNDLLTLNVSSSVSYNIVEETNIFWNLFYVANRDFPNEYAFFVKEGYLNMNSAIGVLGMRAWQNTTLDAVWEDCHRATYLNFIATILAIAIIIAFLIRLSIALLRTIFNLIFLSWNVLLFVSYTTQALDKSTVSKK